MGIMSNIGKIYILTSENTNKVYIGSTKAKYLSGRLADHKKDYKKFGENYKNSAKELFKLGGVKISLLEQYEDITREELEFNEGKTMLKYENRVNKRLPRRKLLSAYI